jgi:hypothetical protein
VKPLVTLREALNDPLLLGGALPGDSWAAWRALLLAAMGEPLDEDERALFEKLTGRKHPPGVRVDEFWGVIGRRGGKSKAISTLASYLGGLCDYSDVLTPGERGVLMCLAPEKGQASIALNYIGGALEQSPILSKQIKNRTAETIELDNGIDIEVRSASFRRTRGFTSVGVIGDEAAFWHADDSANPDTEILNAVRPSLATTAGLLAVISSPHARRGAVWDTYKTNFGSAGDPLILVAQGASRDLNPTLPQSVIDRAYERDAASASAEYGAQFRTDIERFITVEAVEATTDDVGERPYDRKHIYYGFVDPSGGSTDSFTLGIAHKEGKTAVLDLIRERKPPFSPEGVCEEFSSVLRGYKINTVRGDRYGGEFPREQFQKHGIFYEPAEKTKSEYYLHMLPLINSRTAALLKIDALQKQLVGLERKTSRAGKDTVDHAPGGRDDVANAAAGALTEADIGGAGVRNFNRALEYPSTGIA